MSVDSSPTSRQSADPSVCGPVYRRHRNGDDARLNALYNSVFGHRRPLAEWQWKFDGNRRATGLCGHIIDVAESEGEIIGQFASLTGRFKVRKDEVVLAQGIETAVDVGHRGGLVIVHLARAHTRTLAESKILFGYGLPNDRHYKVGRWLLGYRDLCPLATYWRRLGLGHAVQRRLPWLPAGVIRAGAEAWALLQRSTINGAPSAGLSVREVARFGPEVNDLWQRAQERYGILAVRDSRYLNWRYADHPQRPYAIVYAERGQRLCGFAVLRTANEGGALIGLIMDLFAEPDLAVEQILVRNALLWFLARGADYALCRLVPEDPVAQSLVACGFREHPAFPVLKVVHAPHQRAEELYPFMQDAREWHLCYGDFDGQ